ncbi:AAA family ATPase [Solidesulfovibrio alcoholivorans]|uniref:AAA family ATPase n=1 Tax=Solidesulfovibrio alcoholivorans TaxID=81406 RepID=UPI000A05A7E3|nr:AAA family ATPase [Solidesulfovibrio alcoholivorans]
MSKQDLKNNEEWIKCVGERNLIDLYDVDRFIKDDIFISVVEYYYSTNIKNSHVPRWISNLNTAMYAEPAMLFDRDNNFVVRYDGMAMNSVVEAYSILNNLTKINAASSLGQEIKINSESLFGLFNVQRHQDQPEISNKFNYPVGEYLPGQIETRDGHFKLDRVVYIKNISGNISGGIVVYKSDKRYVALPAHVKKYDQSNGHPCYEMHLGRASKLLRLVNEDLIEKNREAVVVFFENPVVADFFQKKIHDSALVYDKDVVVTTFFGGFPEMDNVYFDRLYGRDVVLVPSISRNSYLNMLEYAKKIEAIGARSVLICPEPYVLYDGGDCNITFNGKWEQYVAQNAISFLPKEASLLVNRIKKLSLSMKQFEAWCVKHDLVDNPESNVDDTFLMNASEMVDLLSASNYKQYRFFDSLIAFDNFTLIYGPSNAGKGMLLLTFLHSIAYKINSFGFKVEHPRKVLLVDGESGVKKLRQRFSQLAEAYPYEDLYKDNLLFISLRDTKKLSGNFFSNDNQILLIKLIKDNGISVVALDNLFSILREQTMAEKAVSEIINFAEKMAEIGVASIFAHHTNKEGGMHGSQKLHNLMQNVIKIAGKESAEKGYFKGVDEKFLKKPGALINVTYEKCKEYIELENNQSVFFLNKPMIDSKASKWVNLSSEDDGDNEQDVEEFVTATNTCADTIEDYVESDAAEDNVESENQSSSCNNPELTDQENQIFEFIKENVKTKKKEIVKYTKIKEHRVKEILFSLLGKGLIRKEGSTSDTFYIVSS